MPEPRLTREQDAELRRLLSQARHDEPLPEDVALRLDRVLAGLRAEGSPAAPVADLDERRDAARARRRRTTTWLLVAAAAVLVVGVGVGQAVSRGASDDSTADSSVGVDRAGGTALSGPPDLPSAQSSTQSSAQSSAQPPAPSSDASSGSPYGRSALSPELRAQLPVQLSSSRLGRDVRHASALAAARLQPGTAAIRESIPGWTCAGSFTPTGDADLVLPATYDGTPTLLVLSPTDAGRQKGRVLACGTFTTVRRLIVGGS